MIKKKICFFTGTRAEYGLLNPLMLKVKKNKEFQLQIIASGMHLSPEFGLTFNEIIKDGFKIDEKVEMLLSSDTPCGLSKSVGLGLMSIAEAYQRLKPDLVVILGDRFESFSAAAAALICRVPIAHLHGGEATFGVIDEAIRHSITKMSLLHFTATKEYRKRVIQLGETPGRVFNVGSLGVDNIKNLRLMQRQDLENELKFKFGEKMMLVTFHPVTLENNTAAEQFTELLKALNEFRDYKIIFTKPNADTGGRIIMKLIDNYVERNSGRAAAFISLGKIKYLSAVKYADVVLGNSSSGIIEAPSFHKPTVNIGDRQKGRVKAKSIIDCKPAKKSIVFALRKAFSPEFLSICKDVKNPYYRPHTADTIYNILRRNITNLNKNKKVFFELS